MPREIERRFLVTLDTFKENSHSFDITQIYLSIMDKIAVRVRIDGIRASLAIKSKVSERVNHEYEYSIPIDEARSIILLDNFPIIRKTRYIVEYEGHTWVVDKFHDENEGLVVAEIELNTENERFISPPWVGEEITADYRYLNTNLAITPFRKW